MPTTITNVAIEAVTAIYAMSSVSRPQALAVSAPAGSAAATLFKI